MTAVSLQDEPYDYASWAAAAVAAAQPASNDNRASDVRLDQHYTQPRIAAYFFRVFCWHCDAPRYFMVEPSAGEGAFYRVMPKGSLGVDVEPKYPGVREADFLKIRIGGDRPVAAVGNPPFGRNSSTAVRFFNHAALEAEVIAFILPRTFRKVSVQNRLNFQFHLLHEEEVPANAFLFRGKPFHVPAIFQIWARRTQPREKIMIETRHQDFEFTTPKRCHFVVQRVGENAGKVHGRRKMSPSSHLFIRSNIGARRLKTIMKQLDLAGAARNVAGNPSVSKGEIVSLYGKLTGRPAGPQGRRPKTA